MPFFKKCSIIVVTVLCLILTTTASFSATVVMRRSINFGTIIASPFGDIIEIDAKDGPALPSVLTSGYSHVDDDGHSGLIQVTSDSAGQIIQIVYPDEVLLKADSGGATIKFNAINTRSRTSAISKAANEEIDFDIGGCLNISGQIQELYSETMTVTINIINP